MPRSSWQEDVDEIVKDETQPGHLLHPDHVIERDNPHHNFEQRVLDRLERIDILLTTINLRLAGGGTGGGP